MDEPSDDVRRWLEALEHSSPGGGEEVALSLAYRAAGSVTLDEQDVRGALRRALLLLAAGGDPRRALDLDSRAVRAVADDLDRPDRRHDLGAALDGLSELAEGLPGVAAALASLADDLDLAWRCLAYALLADELFEDADA